MRCYFAGASLPVVATADAATVSLRHPLPVGRSRVNCTAPSKAQRGRYYWYSQPWFIAREDGSFPE